MTIDIVGAGIGGLTTAIALQQKGIATRIYEQAPSLKPVGAGIVLANNAMQVYQRLSLKEPIEAVGNPLSSANITDAQLQPISSMVLTYFEEKYQVRNLAIHRAALQQLLVDHLTQSELHFDHKVEQLSVQDQHLAIKFTNGKEITTTHLVGADGIRSAVRDGALGKKPLRNAQQLCWRGVVNFDLPTAHHHEINEAWGKGSRFGFVQIAPRKVYWFAVQTITDKQKTVAVDQLGILFKEFHPTVQNLIAATPIDHIHTDELWDLAPISTWQGKHFCLVGDAAHATTPNMGQGACQAIEGAYVLADCLAKYDWDIAIKKYQQLRIKKAHHVVNTSWMIGKMAHWKNPIATSLRNQMMRLLPEKMSQKQIEPLFELEV